MYCLCHKTSEKLVDMSLIGHSVHFRKVLITICANYMLTDKGIFIKKVKMASFTSPDLPSSRDVRVSKMLILFPLTAALLSCGVSHSHCSFPLSFKLTFSCCPPLQQATTSSSYTSGTGLSRSYSTVSFSQLCGLHGCSYLQKRTLCLSCCHVHLLRCPGCLGPLIFSSWTLSTWCWPEICALVR